MTLFAVKYDHSLGKEVRRYTRAQFPVAIDPDNEAATPYPDLDPNETIYIVYHVQPQGDGVDERLFDRVQSDTPDPTPHPVFVNYPTWRVEWSTVAKPKEEVKSWVANRVVTAHNNRMEQLRLLANLPGWRDMLQTLGIGVLFANAAGMQLSAVERAIKDASIEAARATRADILNAIDIMGKIDNDQPVDIDANWEPEA